MYVTPVECEVQCWTTDHINTVLPGQPVELSAGYTITKEAGAYKLEYRGELIDTENCAKLTQDSKDPSKATLVFNNLKEGFNGHQVIVSVKVGQVIDGQFLEDSTGGAIVSVTESFDDLIVQGVNPYLNVGKKQTFKAELRRYSVDNENGYEVIPNVTYTCSIG